MVVTGTTGALGSYILAQLVASDDVHRIYALNRPASDGTPLIERQVVALTNRGLDGQIAYSQKVNLLEADLGKSDLGLCDTDLQEVRIA